MNTEQFADTRIGMLLVRLLASAMESRFRYRFFPPDAILHCIEELPGRAVLEVGCGTGFFTIPAARIIGDGGRLVAIDILSESVELVTKKAQEARLANVRIIKANALETELETESFDVVLLFGVIPAPMLPLDRLLPEMHRLLKQEGLLVVWPRIPRWLPKAIVRSGLFACANSLDRVYEFKKL